MRHFIERIHAELLSKSDPKHRDQLLWFFKEQTVDPFGVRSMEMNRIVSMFWKEIKEWDKTSIWSLCDQLWQTGILEDGHLACKFAFRAASRFSSDDFDVFSTWVHNYIYNWAHCDDLCTKALGTLLLGHPSHLPPMENWTKSGNRFVRRGAAVSLLPSLKHGRQLVHAFQIADQLMQDDDHLVRKGYGWMLKVASQSFPDEVYAYVIDNRATMPRDALRYAIEKLPADMRQEAMRK